MSAAHLKAPDVPRPTLAGPPWCSGKEPFASPALAVRAAARVTGRSHYRCSFCGFWHVGSDANAHTTGHNTDRLIRREGEK